MAQHEPRVLFQTIPRNEFAQLHELNCAGELNIWNCVRRGQTKRTGWFKLKLPSYAASLHAVFPSIGTHRADL